MRILFKNLFENASIAASSFSVNYPPKNLIHEFLELRFQSAISVFTSLITFTFDEDQEMDCFFYGYHNLSELSVVYKNSGGGTLQTINITDPDDIGIEYFTKISTIRSVELTVTASPPSSEPLTACRLGGVGGGVCYAMPDPLAVYTPGNKDNSDYSESPHGQTLQNYIKPLRKLSYGFRDNTNTIRKEFDTLYKSVGKGKGLFFDLYEDARDKEPPLYGKLTDSVDYPYKPQQYDFTIKIQESR